MKLSGPYACRLPILLGLVAFVWCGRGNAQDDGFYRLAGEHIRLTTDMNAPQQLRDWVDSFDTAVGQWFRFWGIPDERRSEFRVEGYVMRNADRFRDRGMLPRSVGDFPFGTADGSRFWVHEQPSEYYTRHLLLHEGVHVLMFQYFGGAGPSWFMEGTAELLSVHSGKSASISVNQVPRDRGSVESWGRFKLLSKRRLEGKVPHLESVMRLPRRLNGNVEAYGWSWAAVMMLSQYPRTRDAVLNASKRASDSTSQFTQALYRELFPVWPVIQARWAMMNLELDYGFDWSRETIDISMDDPEFDRTVQQLSLRADHGWQSVGVRFPAGSEIEIRCEGQVTMANKVRPWISEPRGISIDHHRGEKIGKVLACLVSTETPRSKTIQLPQILPVGSSSKISIDQASWLLMRVNDSPRSMMDNSGAYRIEIRSRN